MFGSGWQAQGQLEALAAVRKLERVKVFSRTAEKVARFCERMGRKLSLDVPVDIIAGKAYEWNVAEEGKQMSVQN